jgi:hypothetical protein
LTISLKHELHWKARPWCLSSRRSTAASTPYAIPLVENSLCPKIQIRLEIEALLEHADLWIAHDQVIDKRAAELRKLGFKEFDAYHIAAAETAVCDRLVTCDDNFLKAARRNAAKIGVPVTDPIRLVSEAAF